MSHAITSSRPVMYRRTPLTGFEAFRVNGTPADCVTLGIHHWKDVELVLSGINLGTNLGNALWFSGTLAAAKQGALLGVRAVAFSTPATETEPDFSKVIPWAEKALDLILTHTRIPLVNVNLPENPTGLAWTRQSVRHYDGKVVPDRDPSGREQFWFSTVPVEQVEPGTDRWAFEQELVSMTPLSLDLTDEEELRELQSKRPLEEHAVKSQEAGPLKVASALREGRAGLVERGDVGN
jgi:5'-nucleotidase